MENHISMSNFMFDPIQCFLSTDRTCCIPVSHGTFIPTGATNLTFVLLGPSSHIELQLSLCSLDLKCV